MVTYTSKLQEESGPDVSIDEKLIDRVRMIYSIGEELDMDYEFTEIKLYNTEESIEYFEATEFEYQSSEVPEIQEIEMELEFEYGNLVAEYDRGSNAFKVELDMAEKDVELFEEMLGDEFKMSLPDRLKSTAFSNLKRLKNMRY